MFPQAVVRYGSGTKGGSYAWAAPKDRCIATYGALVPGAMEPELVVLDARVLLSGGMENNRTIHGVPPLPPTADVGVLCFRLFYSGCWRQEMLLSIMVVGTAGYAWWR